ncbi:MAG: hypothetical protein ACLU99_15060 [Alphaproteobacteria bacterium]
MNRVSNERVAQLNRELNIAKARNASLSETRKIEDEILAERTKAHNKSVGFYGQELNDLEANRAKLKQLNDMLLQLNNAKARGDKKVYIDVDLDGKIDKVKVDEAIEAVQGQIDNTGRAVDIAVNLKTEGRIWTPKGKYKPPKEQTKTGTPPKRKRIYCAKPRTPGLP